MRTLARSMSSLLDLDEITGRLTTTIESSMHVRAARLLVDGLPRDVLAALDVAPGALSRYQRFPARRCHRGSNTGATCPLST